MGARKEEYKGLREKITDFGWGRPGQVPPSEKLCRELKSGKDLPCEDPRKSIIGKEISRYKCPTVAGSGWFRCGELMVEGRGGLGCGERQWPDHSGLWIS